MKLALLGAGRIGRLHARLLAETPGVDELLIADAMPERTIGFGDSYGQPVWQQVPGEFRAKSPR